MMATVAAVARSIAIAPEINIPIDTIVIRKYVRQDIRLPPLFLYSINLSSMFEQFVVAIDIVPTDSLDLEI
jgi:hypothetical protein